MRDPLKAGPRTTRIPQAVTAPINLDLDCVPAARRCSVPLDNVPTGKWNVERYLEAEPFRDCAAAWVTHGALLVP